MDPAAHDRRLKVLIPNLPTFDDLEPWLRRIDDNRHYTNFGPLNRELEEALSALIRAEHAVTVSSGTLGLELALTALGLRAGSRVLVPSMTFPASATAIVRAGLIPVFGDIDDRRLVMTPDIARRSASETDVRAVLTVAVHGEVHDPDAWDAFTAETGLPVLIDAAGVVGRQRVGRTTSAVFSLHATKPIAAGEGGVVATRDAAMARRVRSLSNFGFDTGRVRAVGTNAKLSEYHAALGLAALARWPRTLERWTSLYDTYAHLLQTSDPEAGLRLATARTAPSNLCVRVKQTIDDRHIQALSGVGIETRRWYWPPVHRHPAFSRYACVGDLATTDRAGAELLGLPFSLDLDRDDIERVCAALRSTLIPENAAPHGCADLAGLAAGGVPRGVGRGFDPDPSGPPEGTPSRM